MLAASGCASSPVARTELLHSADPGIQRVSYTDADEQPVVYVMSNGFHSGLIMRMSDVPREVWPEVDEIGEHVWVEVGWGSEIFYRAKKITMPIVLGAMIPNDTVLHVVGWDARPERALPKCDLVRLQIDEDRLTALCRFIHDSYELDDNGRTRYLGEGIYGDSAFYRARGTYYFPNTCNVWTARGLRAAGMTVIPELCSTADAVLLAARRAGTTVQRR